MLHAAIDKAVVQMDSLQVIIEQGDRIGVDYPAESKPFKRSHEPKVIRQALTLLKSALHQFSVSPDVEEDQRVYTLEIGGARILLFKKE